MPNGAKFASTCASVNVVIRVKFLSYISTTPSWKLVAYRKWPVGVLAMASPLYTAPAPEWSTAIMACVPLTVGLQPRMVPSSVAKRNGGDPDLPLAATTNSPVPLNTRPVGVPPPVGFVGDGIVTTRGAATGKAWPRPLYSVETPLPLSATQKGEVGLNARPQGLTRFGSVNRATPAISETRFTRVYTCSLSISPGTAPVPHSSASITTPITASRFMTFTLQKVCGMSFTCVRDQSRL